MEKNSSTGDRPKALVYVRVSTKEQVDGASLGIQEKTCVEYAENVLNCDVMEVYREEGESAKTANRTQLNRMLSYVATHKGDVDFVVCYQVDRITREMASFSMGIKTILSKYGVKLRYALNPGINDSAEGKFMETLLVGVAQLENDIKAKKVHDAMSERAQQGYWVTQAPVGFIVKTVMPDGGLADSIRGERRKYPKILVPDERDGLAEKLTEVMMRFSTGDMTETQAYELALKLGITGAQGAPLTFSRFDVIMRSPVYAGYNNSKKLLGGEMKKLKFDGLIPFEIWERNQFILNKDKRELKLRNDNLYPLDGTLLCSCCGMPLHGDAPRDGSGAYKSRYYCRGGAKRGHGYISAKTEETHEIFDSLLQRLMPKPGTVRLFKEILKRTAYRKLTDSTTELKQLDEQEAHIDMSTLFHTIL